MDRKQPNPINEIKYFIDSGMFQLNTRTEKASIACGVDFAYYPFDEHVCEFAMIPSKNLSYQGLKLRIGQTKKILAQTLTIFQDFETTVSFKPGSIYSNTYDVEYKPLEKMTHTMKTRGGNETFALTGFRIGFRRSSGPFIMNVFLPTGMLTFISFIGFLIPVDIVPGRMALLVTIFLMLVNISAQEHNKGSKPLVRS